VSDHSDKNPVEHMADLLVYAPIGLFFEGPSLLPKLAEQGRVHARNARLFGQFAVRHGEAEVRRRMSQLEDQASGLLRALGVLLDGPGADGEEAEAPVAAAPPAAPDAAPARRVPGEPVPRVADLAITDYDSLSASHVVARLPGLTPDELAAVQRYEAGHRRRKTILNKVAQLQA
jgi:hypothetical protein